MINKICESLRAAVADIEDGSVVMIGGFGNSGIPMQLIEALRLHGARELTIISNNAGTAEEGIASLLRDRLVRKMVCSFPRSSGSIWFERLYEKGEIELELVPQGTLAERIRAAGAGLGGVYTPTGYGTRLADGKETKVINGKGYVLETAMPADVALIKAHRGDAWGNLIYNTAGRNFNPIMATAARITIAEVNAVVEVGELDPEHVVTPGIFVDRVVVQEVQQHAAA
ncbi:3-oxoacid CoA-transferase subunit A [Marinobacter sp. M3C]|uniref:3-oxoacid CoA-transferase subunit A n=1 Tax=unclassified Marinobacter TaxID=83889 RepID=UPI00200F4848|nr:MULTISPECIES: 3-oxoacid CoA-transferase subunit A [unclassified Marinobacter]MCL1476805.1 3-oxoacid CoA-transferase subunit A [Marinobacter sp.]MCL1479906.1 3-oxoacid CoA-transferase subunit A [Marinobacter sp.]MCL1485019.1 3-oxoacid CoA-transferase subunit A [Marinobacter sp.]UQG57333.1 3-oxoacid CoA-transferase subunit A [Marinobacter sp. M4C]UQG61493.1 3-oxoacid CoA-transferase subunit A [Marinobacter sp. M3C]